MQWPVRKLNALQYTLLIDSADGAGKPTACTSLLARSKDLQCLAQGIHLPLEFGNADAEMGLSAKGEFKKLLASEVSSLIAFS